MMEEKKGLKIKITIAVLIYAVLFLTIVMIANNAKIGAWLFDVYMLFRPVLFGLALAYLCNPLFRLFERKILYRIRLIGLRRTLSLLLTYVFFFFAIALILLMIVPQLIDSALLLVTNYSEYLSSAIQTINGIFAAVNGFVGNMTGNDSFLEYLDADAIQKGLMGFFENFGNMQQTLMDLLADVNLQQLQAFFGDAVTLFKDFIFAIFISIYLLSTKEKRYAQVMKLTRALFSEKVNTNILQFCKIANQSFGSFLEGKVVDSLIVALIIYIAVSLFGIPYAVLIAAFVGIMNIIPIIGFLTAGVLTSFIVLLTDPAKLLPFLIILLLVYQIDINIISPKILGNNTGVSSLCVIIAITVMGTIWGLIGLLLGVPLFATILILVENWTVSRLQRKGLPSGLANYYANNSQVNPIKDADAATDRSVQNFEKRILLIRKKYEMGIALSSREKFHFQIYKLAHKYHIINDLTDEAHVRFSAEQAAKEASSRADALLTQYRTARDTQKAPASDEGHPDL